MAQTGYTPILIYSSSTTTNVPAAGSLTNSALGSELAINIADGKLFYKDSSNNVQVIGWKTVPTTAGGTGLTSYTAGDLVYYASGTAFTKLAIGASGRWLGSSGTAPQWNAPAALTKTDDTNVTLTLGGSASTALLNAASLTLGWTGTLAVSRGGTGLSTWTTNGIIYASGTTTLAQSANFTFDGNNVGIGTNSPITPLQVNGTITATSVNTNNTFGFKNRIINGAMMIDQRNAGASVTFDATNKYVTDRFFGFSNVGTTTSQQSTDAPSGFINSLLVTQATGGSVVSSSYLAIQQRIEGFNVADLGFGTASAKTVTLSFWVRSSITGTFSVAMLNSAENRSYVTDYTINSANTWEQKKITVAGDTSGTWLTNNGVGISLVWNLGYGSTYTTSTLNSWIGSGAYGSTTATTSFATTSGATFYITGVQLEVGSTATSFDYRPYETELVLCQRYYEKSFDQTTKPVQNFGSIQGGLCTGVYSTSANTALATATFAAEKRASPTITTFNPFAAGSGWSESGGGNIAAGVYAVGTRAVTIRCQAATGAVGNNLSIHWTASIEL
jgi:hypothetical protein